MGARRSITNSYSGLPNSPEFEFWSFGRNQAAPDPIRVLSADELFSDGVLIPLDLILSVSHPRRLSVEPPPPDGHYTGAVADQHDTHEQEGRPGSLIATTAEPETCSKRWIDIFKRNEKKSPLNDQVDLIATVACGKKKEIMEKFDKGKRKEKRSSGGSGSASGAAELNIYIWPFSRSRSAGNTRAPHNAAAVRKVSSAPCSRSNSAGDTSARSSCSSSKWPSSPGRIGVHLSRSSPVWRPKRGRASASAAFLSSIASSKNYSTETKQQVLNVNVPTLLYESGNRLGCGSSANGGPNGRGGLFNLRGLFTKKVH
ncbi:hypothetical protein SAY87_008845 [Trapa incisa]|uniref:Uncharacterized protein n=1 Tax=Trapa incisa TaxID=236973 RepID=A0AAN7PWU4_9MYRT|nr:hypothetical protein SAY87_008845 [Trapa incisa]